MIDPRPLVLVHVLAASAPVRADDADPEVRAFLKSWAERMRGVETLRVEFTQTKDLPILRKPLVSRGFALLKGRRLLVVVEKEGERDMELRVDGDEARLHYPKLKRLEVFALRAGGAGEGGVAATPFPLFGGGDVEALPETYRVSLAREERGDVLVLAPRDGSSPVEEGRMLFRDGRVAEVAEKNRRGESVRLEITAFKPNEPIEDASLELSLAPDTKVVHLTPGGGRTE